MSMGRLATRRFALDAPYSWFAFAEPFAAPGVHIGKSFFTSFAARSGAVLTPASAHAGLVPGFGALECDRFHPGEVDPLIVDFYEHTADFSMKVDGAFTPLFRGISKLLYRPLAKLAEQLDVPDFQPGVQREMASQFGFIEPGQGAPSRIWIRSMKDDGSTFYVGAVHDSITETDRVKHAYITMVFPLRRSNLAVMLELENVAGGGFRMTTNPSKPSDAGTYLVIPGATSVSWVAVPGADEHFTFRVSRSGPGPCHDGAASGPKPQAPTGPCIEGTHEAYWLGQKAFALDYHIARSRPATPAPGLLEVTRKSMPLPRLGEGFVPIGALQVAPAGPRGGGG
jgi:hypothetical protein